MFVCPICKTEVLEENYFQHLILEQKTHFEPFRKGTCTQILLQITCSTQYAFEVAEKLCENGHFPTYQINKVTEFVAEMIRVAGYSHRKKVNQIREAAGGVVIGSMPTDDELNIALYSVLGISERESIPEVLTPIRVEYVLNDREPGLAYVANDRVQITRIFTFAAAHHLPYHKGLCRFTHGHEWKLEVTVADYKNPHTEMVLDFSDLKKAVNENIINKLDHNYLNDLMYNPTAENLCEWIWRKLSDVTGYPIYSIKLWESENSFAILDKHNKAGV